MKELFDMLVQFFGYLILGIIQGLTEVFPVSSSAHLAIARSFLQKNFDFEGFGFEAAVFLHLGTLAAIFALYRKDVFDLGRSFLTTIKQRLAPLYDRIDPEAAHLNPRTPFLMLFSLCVTVLFALALKYPAERLFYRVSSISALLVINGLIILAVARFASGNKRIDEIGLLDYALIGAAQGIAVLPGISRFGMTLCAGLWRGLGWFEALKLSFLLSLPTVLGAVVLKVAEGAMAGDVLKHLDLAGVTFSTVIAAIVGYLAIKFLLKKNLHTRNKLTYFGYYCSMVGLFFFVLFRYLD